jgi:hypothetical protein
MYQLTVKHAKRNQIANVQIEPNCEVKEIVNKVKNQMNLEDYEIKLILNGRILSETEKIGDIPEIVYCVSFKNSEQSPILLPQNIAQFMRERENRISSSPNIPDTPMNSYIDNVFSYHRELTQLVEMGFTDNLRLRDLLDECSGDIEMVINTLNV